MSLFLVRNGSQWDAELAGAALPFGARRLCCPGGPVEGGGEWRQGVTPIGGAASERPFGIEGERTALARLEFLCYAAKLGQRASGVVNARLS